MVLWHPVSNEVYMSPATFAVLLDPEDQPTKEGQVLRDCFGRPLNFIWTFRVQIDRSGFV